MEIGHEENIVMGEARVLLQRVRDIILDTPETFDMDYWFQDTEGNWLTRGEIERLLYHPEIVSEEEKCGTVCCIGGWLVSLVAHDLPTGKEEYRTIESTILAEASLAIGLPEDLAIGLFVERRWPAALRNAYNDARGENDRFGMAWAAAGAIDLFLANEIDGFDFSYNDDSYGYDDDDDDDGYLWSSDDDDGYLWSSDDDDDGFWA